MRKILILDERAPTRRALRSFAETAGAEVSEAATMDEAWVMVTANGPPSILMCAFVQLTFAEELTVRHPGIRVVVVGSELDVEAAVTSLRAGVADYLTPPLTRSSVTDSIRRAEAQIAAAEQAAALAPTVATPSAPPLVANVHLRNDFDASDLVTVLVDILDVREPGAREHAQRVSRLAVNLAHSLHVDPAEVSEIERAALLHDLAHLTNDIHRAPIGEVGRHDVRTPHADALSILGNVSSLTSAARIAASVAAAAGRRSQTAAPLPLAAEILTVANAYDELVTGIGCEPVPTAVAVNMLCRDASSKFDPAVLSALMSMQRQAYSRMAADAEPPKWEPRRRWPRKQLPFDLVGTVSTHPVRVVDVGYGGFRLEAPRTLPAINAERFVLALPTFGLRVTAVWRWTKLLDRTNNIWCGAAIDSENPDSDGSWREFVDRTPSAAAGIGSFT
jgi:response regulator RpfG family c-di-GMP phosphodiesterase